MKQVKLTLAVSLAAALMLVGCGRQRADAPPAAGDVPAPAAADAQVSEAGSPETATATNGALNSAQGFAQKLEDSPFASADPALKETFARALIACEIGDYARALDELNDLSAAAGLTPRQSQAVRDLSAKAKAAAPQVAVSNAVPAASVAVYALAPTTDPPFSTAEPAVVEGFARARIAFDIGNYPIAEAELNSLINNPQLNWQQKYAVQALLDRIPHTAPAGPAGSQGPAPGQ